VLSNSDYVSDTFVASNPRKGWLSRPIPIFEMEIRVANASVLDFDETFPGSELRLLLDREVSLDFVILAEFGDDG
jgi:hypothetical protein